MKFIDLGQGLLLHRQLSDAALEAATSIAEEPGTTVSLSYRSGSFARAKPKNHDKVAQAAESGKLNLLMKSNDKEITAIRSLLTRKAIFTRCPMTASSSVPAVYCPPAF